MHRIPRLLAAALGFTTMACAQQKPQVQQTSAPAAVKSVVVNVVVQSKDGRPIRGLKQTDFHVTEGGAPQTISSFTEHSTLSPPQPLPASSPMPPGLFTDFTAVPPNSTLNVLIIDALNTPAKDQRFLYDQLQQVVNHLDPRAHLAIFGLANHLVLLQGFNSDPAALKSVLNHKLIPRSPALANHTDAAAGASSASQQNPAEMAHFAANLEEFEKQEAAIEVQLRPQITLDAFNTLGHYLSSLPGHKNVIWFSGSFPLILSPEAHAKKSSDASLPDQDEVHETATLLTEAQVSVYPLDARALMARSSHSPSAKPSKASDDTPKFNPAEERARMTAIATETGGEAFPGVTNLSDAVSKTIDIGSNYYALAYTPTNPADDGKYRAITVDLASAAQAPNLQLAYSHGYYAASAVQPPATEAATSAKGDAATPQPVAAYVRAAMSRGAPTPDSVLFKVRVLPAEAGTQTKIAAGNTLDPNLSPTGPFRNFNVDYVSLLNQLTLQEEANGNRTGAVEFVIYVFNTDGRLLNAVGKKVSINLPTVTYQHVVNSAMEFHMEISVPTEQDTFLRIGMRDVTTNRFGVVEIPTADVSHLSPLTANSPPLSKDVPSPARTATPASNPPTSTPSTPPAATSPKPAPQR